jgi:hypothetical protein
MSGAPGSGHPLPESKEARHGEVPEHLEEEKGKGEDGAEFATPHPEGVTPSGRPYKADPDV